MEFTCECELCDNCNSHPNECICENKKCKACYTNKGDKRSMWSCCDHCEHCGLSINKPCYCDYILNGVNTVLCTCIRCKVCDRVESYCICSF